VLQKSVTDTPIRKKGGVSLSNSYFVRDLVLTLLAAVFTGITSSILLILLVFGWNSAAADGLYQPRPELQLRVLDGRQLGQALMLKSDIQIDITGILAKVRVEHHFVNPC
jgi:hypothetical protein